MLDVLERPEKSVFNSPSPLKITICDSLGCASLRLVAMAESDLERLREARETPVNPTNLVGAS